MTPELLENDVYLFVTHLVLHLDRLNYDKQKIAQALSVAWEMRNAWDDAVGQKRMYGWSEVVLALNKFNDYKDGFDFWDFKASDREDYYNVFMELIQYDA